MYLDSWKWQVSSFTITDIPGQVLQTVNYQWRVQAGRNKRAPPLDVDQ